MAVAVYTKLENKSFVYISISKFLGNYIVSVVILYFRAVFNKQLKLILHVMKLNIYIGLGNYLSSCHGGE